MKVLLASFLRGRNYGDVLIYETVKKALEKKGVEVSHLEVSSIFNIDFVNQHDFLLFPGGGLIEKSAPDIIRAWNYFKEFIEIPYGIMGLSAGLFDYSNMASSLKEFVNGSDFFYVRDFDTKLIFEWYGAEKGKIKVTCDTAWAYDFPERKKEFEIRPIIYATFRDMPYPELTGEFPFNHWERALRENNVNYIIPDEYEFLSTKIKECDILIAMRYHAILTALYYGIMPIAIGYCPKVERLMGELGLRDYCFKHTDYFKIKDILKKVNPLYSAFKDTRLIQFKAKEMINEVIERILSYEK